MDKEMIKEVWRKATIVPGVDKNNLRKDQCGAWIKFSDYGNRNSETGWEIDHIKPISKGGKDNIENLRPLQWQNNAEKSDGRLTVSFRQVCLNKLSLM